jgi:hypothetical protein
MNWNKRTLVLSNLFYALLLAACNAFTLRSTPTPNVTPTLLLPMPSPVPTLTPTPIPTPTSIPAPARATYLLDTSIDYDRHAVLVDELIVYPNHTGRPLDSLVLAVVPNLWPDCFTLENVAIDSVSVTSYTLNGQRMDLTLPVLFDPETTLSISIKYQLSLPLITSEDPNVSRPRIFGFSDKQINLTNWYPFVVPNMNDDWVLHDPWYYGEHLVYDASDFEVNLRLTDPADPPVVAASGFPEPNGDATRYTLTNGRAFAISASRQFQVSSLQLGDVTVSSYTFPFFQGQGQAALQTSTEALQTYSQRFGPYPHKTLAIVMGDFNDGMEFSAFYFLPRDFYNLYNDNAAHNYLITVSAHETAHQWWFEQVANDQALQPWLDESLSTYSEKLYYEAFHPDKLPQWWSYRIDFYNPQGFIDSPIYDFIGFRPYTDTVYFRGVHFLEDLRTRIGEDAFFSFLQDYLNQGNARIVNSNDFFQILKTHTSTDYSDIVRQYFQNIY